MVTATSTRASDRMGDGASDGVSDGVSEQGRRVRFTRRYRPEAAERAYRAAVARAYATVPHYREAWAGARTVSEAPRELTVSEVERAPGRLFPLAAPHDPAREPSPWPDRPRRLHESLRLTGTHRERGHLFEIRTALVDWTRLGRGRYTVLLGPSAEAVDDGVRTRGFDAFRAAAEPALVGEGHEIAAVLAASGRTGPVRVHLRRTCAGLASDDGRARTGELLYDAVLGYLGGRHHECGLMHLNWPRFHARAGAGGLLVTDLQRCRPTLVDLAIEGTGGLNVARCGRHGTPVLIRPEKAGPENAGPEHAGREHAEPDR